MTVNSRLNIDIEIIVELWIDGVVLAFTEETCREWPVRLISSSAAALENEEKLE
jgi:hypothetical protein